MNTLFIVLRFLWKRKLANLILIFEMMLSIVMLAQLFVFVMKHIDNKRAINELPIKNAFVLNTFDYYYSELIMERIKCSPVVDSIGRVYMGYAICKDAPCNLAVYNEGIIDHYSPELDNGVWLDSPSTVDDEKIRAVVSADIGLKVGDTVSVNLTKRGMSQLIVVGILKEPTQYLFPSGGASSKLFSAESIIKQSSVIIIRESEFGDAAVLLPPQEIPVPQNIFVFMKDNCSKSDINVALDSWRKYGEVTPMASLILTYNKNTEELISAGAIFFAVFLFLAVTSVLSNNVIQNLNNRRQFTIYYLLGMNWKRGLTIEIDRIILLIIMTMGLTIIAGKYGLLMLEWMTIDRIVLFYGIVFIYIIFMFTIVGAGFIFKLVHEDISSMLKDLQQGE